MAQYRKSMKGGGISIDDISTMLIDGGYFRAKIRGLTEFDKVAGGLAWGILNSRFSIDVAFVENAHIRDKIRIAENICAALKQDMQCPHDLEPHQIQGLDYPKIAVVLEWLLKRVAAARDENAHFVNEFTKLDFERRFHTSFERISSNKNGAAAAALSGSIPTLKAPKRVMLSSKSVYESPLEHAATVLLEYGLKYQMKDSVLLLQNTAELEGDSEMQRDVVKLQDDEKKEQAMLESILSQMTAHRERGRLGAGHIDSVMQSTDSEKIAKMRSVYEGRRAELQQRLKEEEEARNALEAQRQRLAELQEDHGAILERVTELEASKSTISSSRANAKDKSERKLRRIEEQIESVEEIERLLRSDTARSAILDQLLALLEEERVLAAKLGEDQERGKARVAAAKEEVIELADRMEALGGDAGRALFEAELSSAREELSTVLASLAKKDQEAMGIMRKMDEFPTRAELQQYEVRISELNDEIAWKFEATRLTYTLHNTRAEIVKCLQNEEEILAQVAQLFEACMGKNAAKKNSDERKLLLEQTSAIVGQLKASQIKQHERVEEERNTIATAKKAYDQLLDKQKEYHRLVEETKQCLEENESLRSQLQSITEEEEQGDDDEEKEE